MLSLNMQTVLFIVCGLAALVVLVYVVAVRLAHSPFTPHVGFWTWLGRWGAFLLWGVRYGLGVSLMGLALVLAAAGEWLLDDPPLTGDWKVPPERPHS